LNTLGLIEAINSDRMITISSCKFNSFTYISNSVLQKNLSFSHVDASISFALPRNGASNLPNALPHNYLTVGTSISTTLTRRSIHARYYKKPLVANSKNSIK
jgi:hypothetical protein